MLPLTENEKILFTKIMQTAKNLNCLPRVAGGWVRDKLLNRQSYDIDIVIDNVSGLFFAEQLNLNSVHVVKKNPAKSKHLETAILKFENFFVDFTQFRKEVYDKTRIPEISVGNEYDDAHRRDLTINSLFFNIEKEKIEDFTGRGLKDLERRILSTPLPPYQTLLDDPLRLLRIIRFSVQLNFTIDDELLPYLKNEKIHLAIANKISAERIQTELCKILNSDNYAKGVKKLCENKLSCIIFKRKLAERNSAIKFTDYSKVYRGDFKFIFRLYAFLIDFSSNSTILKQNLKFSKNIFNSVKIIDENLLYLGKNITTINFENKTKLYFFMRKLKYDYAKISLLIYLAKILIEKNYAPDIFKNIIEKKIEKFSDEPINKILNLLNLIENKKEIFSYQNNIIDIQRIINLNIKKSKIKDVIEYANIFKIIDQNISDEEILIKLEFLFN